MWEIKRFLRYFFSIFNFKRNEIEMTIIKENKIVIVNGKKSIKFIYREKQITPTTYRSWDMNPGDTLTFIYPEKFVKKGKRL